MATRLTDALASVLAELETARNAPGSPETTETDDNGLGVRLGPVRSSQTLPGAPVKLRHAQVRDDAA